MDWKAHFQNLNIKIPCKKIFEEDLSRTMIHVQAPTKALGWKMVELFDRCVFTYVRYIRMDGRTPSTNNEPLFKLVLGADQ